MTIFNATVTAFCKTFFNTTIIALLLLGSTITVASAGSLDVVINGKSHHFNSKYDWNEKNHGLGLEYQLNSSSRWIRTLNANAFVDSLDSMSYMTGAGLKRRIYHTRSLGGFYVDAGIIAFIMARKDIYNYRPFPGVLPAVTIGNSHAAINLTYLPKKAVHDLTWADQVDPTIGGVLFVQFKLPMKSFSINGL